jgi:hypothetical protein
MPTTFGKLNLKDHKEILVLNAPDTFEKEIRGLRDVRVFRRIEDMKALAFALSFVTQRGELHRLSRKLSAKAAGDAILWFALPKRYVEEIFVRFQSGRWLGGAASSGVR